MISNSDYYWYKLYNAKGFGTKTIHSIYSFLNSNGLTVEDFFHFSMNELNLNLNMLKL